MNTSKLTPLLLLLGMLMTMSIFSFPVQAQTAQPRNEQPNTQFGKPPTNTKKAKSPLRKTATPKPAKTATPKPASTATKAPTQQNTVVAASPTTASQPTQMDLTGTPASTLEVPATLSTSVTLAAYSPTPTPQGLNTIVAQQTKTAGATFLTSTSLALTFSPTPTNFGAPTATLTFTPNAAELTATALALTATPLEEISQATVTSSATPSSIPAQISAEQTNTPITPGGQKWYYWVAVVIGTAILLSLFYFLYKEWKKPSIRGL